MIWRGLKNTWLVQMADDTYFCAGCMKDRPIEGRKPVYAKTGKIQRYKCAMCVAKKSVPFFGKKRSIEKEVTQ